MLKANLIIESLAPSAGIKFPVMKMVISPYFPVLNVILLMWVMFVGIALIRKHHKILILQILLGAKDADPVASVLFCNKL
jgi:hypothetical protein